MRTTIRNLYASVRSLDVRIVLIVLLIAVSTGHVGRLFADREDARQAPIGYVLAVAIDGVLAVSLYEAANVRRRLHRAFALFVFLFACAVSGGFNVWYYRQNYPIDPEVISVLLGITAPILAALVSVLRSFGEVERTIAERSEREAEQEAERALRLELFTIEQAEQTKRTETEQKEQTKRERARARTEIAQAQANAAVTTEQSRGNGRLKAGALDDKARTVLSEQPDIGVRPLARELGCPPSTASGILKRIRNRTEREQ